MRILVLGGDGYCGWPTALYLSHRGHQIAVVDNFLRRLWDHELGVLTLTPIAPLPERLRSWKRLSGETIQSFAGDLLKLHLLSESLLDSLLNIAVDLREKIDVTLLLPRVDWRKSRNDREENPSVLPHAVAVGSRPSAKVDHPFPKSRSS